MYETEDTIMIARLIINSDGTTSTFKTYFINLHNDQ
jgi:hypothetical protein